MTAQLSPLIHPGPERLSILVVDDEPMVRETTAWMLSDAAHRVHEAEDGQAAVDFLNAEGAVDLVISDINMPRLDGLQFLAYARRVWPHMPVLLISGRPPPACSTCFMPKPFRWDALLSTVARVARQARLSA